MLKEQEFEFKKAQIRNFLKAEYKRTFTPSAKKSVRKRRKFIQETTKKVSKKFGKDVMCVLHFTKHGFFSVISPSHTESTNKGKLYQSFAHPKVYYTSHCIERFSQRTETTKNCIMTLDAILEDALNTYGEFEGHLVAPLGVFAFHEEDEKLVVKTYINFEMLTDEQLEKFYGKGGAAVLTRDMVSKQNHDSDFLLVDEAAPSHANAAETEEDDLI
ncbi:MAG: hypothetical protein ACE5EK_04960, partial [Nitrospinales bacterium]